MNTEKYWYKPWTWFRKKLKAAEPDPDGTFVDVHLDYEFRALSPGTKGATTGPYPHTLHITDLSPALAEQALAGKRFDWHAGTAPGLAPFSHWRHNLELGGFHAAPWDEVKLYLREG